MSIENQLSIKTIPATITANFDDLKKSLKKELERYEVTVTEDTIAEAKKLCTELNKSKSHIASVRTQQAAIACEPVRIFEENMREFELEIAECRQKLLSQIQAFEEGRKETLLALLIDFRLECWQKFSLREEFQQTEIRDLNIISNLTAKDNLTSKAKNEIIARVQVLKDIQDTTDRRLLELENKCLRAGLFEPLSRIHVESFLFDHGKEYDSKLNALIAAEIEREHHAEKARNAMARKAEKQKEEIEREDEPQLKEEKPAPDTITMPAKSKNGMMNITVNCEFDIEVKEGTRLHLIEDAYRKKIEEAGFKTLSRVFLVSR